MGLKFENIKEIRYDHAENSFQLTNIENKSFKIPVKKPFYTEIFGFLPLETREEARGRMEMGGWNLNIGSHIILDKPTICVLAKEEIDPDSRKVYNVLSCGKAETDWFNRGSDLVKYKRIPQLLANRSG